MATQVIIVPDDNADSRNVAPNILAALGPGAIIYSWDGLRMYVRATLWANMREADKLFLLERGTNA